MFESLENIFILL